MRGLAHKCRLLAFVVGNGGIVLREPVFQAVLRIAHADNAGHVVLIAMNLYFRHDLDELASQLPAPYEPDEAADLVIRVLLSRV